MIFLKEVYNSLFIAKGRLGQALGEAVLQAQGRSGTEEEDPALLQDPEYLLNELKQLRTAVAELYLGIK
jgi:hypothetical protein